MSRAVGVVIGRLRECRAHGPVKLSGRQQTKRRQGGRRLCRSGARAAAHRDRSNRSTKTGAGAGDGAGAGTCS